MYSTRDLYCVGDSIHSGFISCTALYRECKLCDRSLLRPFVRMSLVRYLYDVKSCSGYITFFLRNTDLLLDDEWLRVTVIVSFMKLFGMIGMSSPCSCNNLNEMDGIALNSKSTRRRCVHSLVLSFFFIERDLRRWPLLINASIVISAPPLISAWICTLRKRLFLCPQLLPLVRPGETAWWGGWEQEGRAWCYPKGCCQLQQQ